VVASEGQEQREGWESAGDEVKGPFLGRPWGSAIQLACFKNSIRRQVALAKTPSALACPRAFFASFVGLSTALTVAGKPPLRNALAPATTLSAAPTATARGPSPPPASMPPTSTSPLHAILSATSSPIAPPPAAAAVATPTAPRTGSRSGTSSTAGASGYLHGRDLIGLPVDAPLALLAPITVLPLPDPEAAIKMAAAETGLCACIPAASPDDVRLLRMLQDTSEARARSGGAAPRREGRGGGSAERCKALWELSKAKERARLPPRRPVCSQAGGV